MIVDIVNKNLVISEIKLVNIIRIVSMDNCSNKFFLEEKNKLKNLLYHDEICNENKLHIYKLISSINEELQNRINKEVRN